METRLHDLIARIKELEHELAEELQKNEEYFFYKVRGRKVAFEHWVKARDRPLATGLFRYLFSASPANVLTAPLVWLCLPPALLLEAAALLYQAVCFPLYGIPKVRRRDYLVFDHRHLAYLNAIEKCNCAYCSYFVGLIAFVQEVAARTEQYWCPVKHARRLAGLHSRYARFLEYGDGAGYRRNLERVRRDFDDLR